MTPLPKNKITRAERGKRRAGNTPSLKRDANKAKAPRHKATFMGKLDNFLNKKSGAVKAADNAALSEKMAAPRKENKAAAEVPSAAPKAVKAVDNKNLSKAAPMGRTAAKKITVNKKASTSK